MIEELALDGSKVIIPIKTPPQPPRTPPPPSAAAVKAAVAAPSRREVVVEDPNLVVADQPHETSMAGALVRGGDQAQALEEPPVMGGLDEGAFPARAEGLVQ